MTSPITDVPMHEVRPYEADDPMQGSGQEDEEGDGDPVPNVSDDSSEEGEDDEEEARRHMGQALTFEQNKAQGLCRCRCAP